MATEVYYVDGFDHGAYSQLAHKYLDYSRFDQGTVVEGRQPSSAQGGGRALLQFNSGFRTILKTRKVGARQNQIIGFAYKGSVAQCLIFRWESTDTSGIPGANPNDENLGTQLSILQKSNGAWEFYSGGKGTNANKGTLVGSLPAATFALNTWYYVEIDAKFGPTGWLKVYVNDERILNSASLSLGDGFAPDRFSLRLESLGTQGWTVDDLYVANERLGPCRVQTLWPTGQGSLAQWSQHGMIAKHFDTVDEHLNPGQTTGSIHDSDVTYLQANAAGLDELFTFDEPACYAKVLAVAANAVGKDPLALNAPITSFLCSLEAQLAVVVGQQWPPTSRFGTSQGVFMNDPTSAEWIDKKIGAAAWGMRSAGVGASRVTLFYLEKLVSLRDVVFSCGKRGSYSFGKT